jgi:hypothetical protein
MIRVQRDNARKSEKIDFLEEHVTDLVNELKKKNRLLQMYLMKEESGVLTDEATDRHKVSSVACRAKLLHFNSKIKHNFQNDVLKLAVFS